MEPLQLSLSINFVNSFPDSEQENEKQTTLYIRRRQIIATDAISLENFNRVTVEVR